MSAKKSSGHKKMITSFCLYFTFILFSSYMRQLILLVFIFFLGRSVGFAQYYSTGEDPANIRWKEINTPDFQLIFPAEYEPRAQQLAYILEKVYEYGYRTLDHPPKKISVILHTHTANSNGMVAWSPKRMELFTTPNQRMYAQDWLEQLAVHEFRHVVQMDKIQSELPAVLPVLFGEQAAAAVVGAYLPFWFLEGDAVMTETALTHAGRGRLPSFLMESKAQVLEKGLFSYDKAALGSYRDFVPNRYKFGYWLAGGIRQRYGPEIWSSVLQEIGHKPFSLSPVNHALKQKTGFGKEDLYTAVFQDYVNQWTTEIDSLQLTGQRVVSPHGMSYTNYRYISALTDSSFIAYKESRRDIGRIVRISPHEETLLFTPGPVVEESFSVTGKLLIWSEYRTDLRWTHADQTVIVVYNTETKSKKEFYPENKLFSPVISPDHKTFAAVEADALNHYSLSVFNLQTGQRISQHSTSDNQYFFTPAWDSSAKILYFTALSGKGKYLGALHLSDGTFHALTESTFYDIRNPEYHNGEIYYTSARTGIDNIFRLDLSTLKSTRISSVSFGADYPSVADHSLFFSNYSADGYAVAVLRLDDVSEKPENKISPACYKLAESLAEQEDTVLNFSSPVSFQYPVKPYRKLTHLFNFHSWAPLYINVNDEEVQPGISFLSQNKLGTASTQLGYAYDLNEKTGKYKVEFEYSGLFPIVNTEMSYGKRKSTYRIIQNDVDRQGNVVQRDTVSKDYSWNELRWKINMRVPLYFSQGKYTQILQPEVEYNYERISHDNTTPEQFYEGYYHSLTYRLYFRNMIRKAELDIIPDWGQALDLVYRHSPGGGTGIGSLKAVESYLYFPGFRSNHGIRFYNGYQEKNTDESLTFSDVVRFPRGFSRYQNKDLYSFGAEYVMPLCYPDLGFGKFFFLKRLRSTFFYDFAHVKSTIYDENGTAAGIYSNNLHSLGIELTGDGHLLRLSAPVSIGFRGMYLPDYHEFRGELLFSVSFDSL